MGSRLQLHHDKGNTEELLQCPSQCSSLLSQPAGPGPGASPGPNQLGLAYSAQHPLHTGGSLCASSCADPRAAQPQSGCTGLCSASQTAQTATNARCQARRGEQQAPCRFCCGCWALTRSCPQPSWRRRHQHLDHGAPDTSQPMGDATETAGKARKRALARATQQASTWALQQAPVDTLD